VHDDIRSDELVMRLAVVFAALAMLGLYGVMAHGTALGAAFSRHCCFPLPPQPRLIAVRIIGRIAAPVRMLTHGGSAQCGTAMREHADGRENQY